MSWKSSRCLVTGGAGFIGSNIAETLSHKGSQVIVLDDLSTGREENLKPLQKLGVEFVQGSILDDKLLKHVLVGIDYVFHQAALPSVPRSIEEPFLFNKVNVEGTLKVLEAARQADVKKLIFAASSSAYGETPNQTAVEAMSPSPMSPYAVTKIACEQYCSVYNSIYNLPTTSLRYFNIYGPRQDPSSQYASVIPNFITAAYCDKSPTIYGDGEQSRDFTFVADAVQANLKAALSAKADGQVVNVATGHRTTVNELAQEIIKQVGSDVKPLHVAPRVGEIMHSLADISRAQKLMDYEPQYTLEKGLEETVEYFKNEYYTR